MNHLRREDLDLLVALVADGQPDDDMLDHVAACERCRERLDEAIVDTAAIRVALDHRLGIEEAALRILDEVDRMPAPPPGRYGRTDRAAEGDQPPPRRRERPSRTGQPRFWRFLGLGVAVTTAAILGWSAIPSGSTGPAGDALVTNVARVGTPAASPPVRASAGDASTRTRPTIVAPVALELCWEDPGSATSEDAPRIVLSSLSYALWRLGTHPQALRCPDLRLEKDEFKHLLGSMLDRLDPRDRVKLGQSLLGICQDRAIAIDGLVGRETRAATLAFQSAGTCDSALPHPGTLDKNTLLCLVDATVAGTVVIRGR